MTFETQPSFIQLRDICSERTSKLVAFVGSGLSAAAGLPTWPELKTKLIDELSRKAESFPDTEKSELLRKRDLITGEKNYWKAFGLLRKAMGNTSYTASIKEQLSVAGTLDIPCLLYTSPSPRD